MLFCEPTHSRYVPSKRVGLRQGVNIGPQLDYPSLESLLCARDMCFSFYHSCGDCEECPNDRLGSSSLHLVDGSDESILIHMHLDV